MKTNLLKIRWFFVSSSLQKRKFVFLNPIIRNICKESFFKTASDNNYIIAAFVLMPDHFHLLTGAYDNKTTKEIVSKKYKGAASRRIFLKTPGLKLDLQSQHFWTDGCDKKEISDKILLEKIFRYIIDNPRKKNLPVHYFYLYINPKFQAPNLLGVDRRNEPLITPNKFGASIKKAPNLLGVKRN